MCGAYDVTYATPVFGETLVAPSDIAPNTIHYAPMEDVTVGVNDLLDDPYCFLTKPKRNALTELFGKDIFNRVTMHLVRVANDEIQPLHGFIRDVPRAFAKIKDRNANGTVQLRSLLAN